MKINHFISILALFIGLCFHENTSAQDSKAPKITLTDTEKTPVSQWKNKRVAFLGDSMTDKRRVGTSCIYWEYLTELLGIEPSVYGISGNQWDGIYKQAVKLQSEKGNQIDAILIFAGTNDFNHGVPIGNFYSESLKQTNYNGKEVNRKYRQLIINDSTFCGRINKVLSFLKVNFPQQQIIILTPIHRAYAKFSDKNVQPDENYANEQGIYLDSYIQCLKEASAYWSIPLIDLYSISGLYPLADSHAQYFHDSSTDRLHPNANGDYRIAKTIQYQLLAFPSTFVFK